MNKYLRTHNAWKRREEMKVEPIKTKALYKEASEEEKQRLEKVIEHIEFLLDFCNLRFEEARDAEED